MISQIQLAFQKPYEKSVFIKEILLPIFNTSRLETYPNAVDETHKITVSESKIIKLVAQYGKLTLDDDSQVKLYEILLQPNVQLEYNKIGIQNYIRKTLMTGEAVLVNFVQPLNPNSWRLSFIERDVKFLDNEIRDVKSNPKRYTYIVGQTEVCKTVANRMETLQNSARIVLRPSEIDKNTPNLLKVFSVETLSTAFFDDYKYKHYSRFVEAIMGWSVAKKGKIDVWTKTGKESAFYIKAFKEKYTEEKAQAEARNFVKKLLGRIVFLYFVQKKGWLGATDIDYKDGFDGTISSKDGFGDGFMLYLFKSSNSKDNFYEIWLKELFFNALNQPRKGDNFTMPDQSIVKIPFLNGGLFEVEKHDKIPTILPAKLFHNPDFEDDEKQRGFLDFLNSFNFTIYEDSPEDHTVAVDPEMLGHIFENLLEDNKDKGAYYTPKEIVHYMCQESIIEYLNTKLNPEETPIYNNSSGLELLEHNDSTLLTHANPDYDHNRQEIEDFVKNKVNNDFLLKNAKAVNNYLDNVKVCDPAIGSGAFPMGLMQEIFALKMVLYELEFANDTDKDKNPTIVFHEHEFHQNYRRDTKLNIIQNSIYGVDIEKGAVDIARLRFWLSLIVDENKPQALPNLDYKIVVGDSLIPKFDGEILEIDWDKKTTISPKFNVFIANGKQLLAQIVTKQKAYFDPKTKDKPKAAAEIRDLKINLLINQLAYNKLYYLDNNVKLIDSGLGLTAKEKQKNGVIDLHIALLDNQTKKLNQLLANYDLPFDHFDWKLDFPEILNDQVADVVGFDIVIGNPPYVQSKFMEFEFKKNLISLYKTCTNQFDLFNCFIEICLKLGSCNSFTNFIIPDRFIVNNDYLSLREFLITKSKIKEVITLGDGVFEFVNMPTAILGFTNKKTIDYQFSVKKNLAENGFKVDSKNVFLDKNLKFPVFANTNDSLLLDKINLVSKKITDFFDDIRGVEIGKDSSLITTKKSKYVVPFLIGGDINRYFLNHNKFLKTDDISIKYKDKKWYEGYKIIFRKTGIGINATFDDSGCYVIQVIFIIKLKNQFLKVIDYKFALALINSKLILFWYFKNYGQEDRTTFPHITQGKIKDLPMKQIPLTAQQPFINLVDKILEGKKSSDVTQHWEDEIDVMVYKLYELNFAEAKIIDDKLEEDYFNSIAP